MAIKLLDAYRWGVYTEKNKTEAKFQIEDIGGMLLAKYVCAYMVDILHAHRWFDLLYLVAAVQARLEATLESLARQKLLEPEPQKEFPADDEGESNHGFNVQESNPLEEIRAILKDLATVKNFVVESLDDCFKNPMEANKALRAKVRVLEDVNPKLTTALDLDQMEEAFDVPSLGRKVREAEETYEKDVLAAGRPTKKRGRPFGSSNKAVKSDEKATTAGMTRRKKKLKQDEEKADAVETEGPPYSMDPFDDLEQPTNSRNKCCTIPLYSKCLVVEFAKKVKAEDRVQSVEKEVMVNFRKYFWSPDTERWKTGLLSKWWKYLVFLNGSSLDLCFHSLDLLFEMVQVT